MRASDFKQLPTEILNVFLMMFCVISLCRFKELSLNESTWFHMKKILKCYAFINYTSSNVLLSSNCCDTKVNFFNKKC